MYINQALKSPVVFDIGDYRLSIPKLRMPDWGFMAEQLVADKERALTRKIPDQNTAFRMLAFSPVLPPDLLTVKNWAMSPPGIRKVLSISSSRITIIAKRAPGETEFKPIEPPQKVNIIAKDQTPEDKSILAMMDNIEPDDQQELAWRIADLENERRSQQRKADEAELSGSETFAKDKEGEPDPLP